MAVDIFFSLLVLIVVVILISLAIKRFFRRFPFPTLLSPSNTHSIKELLLFLITNKETRIRLCVTLGVLIVFRIMVFIPSPGINQEALASMFLGSSFARFSIVSLGLMPFFSACLLIQLLSVVIPPLRKATFGDEEGRRKIVRYTLFLTVGLALVQSYGISVWLKDMVGLQGTNLVTMQTVPFRIVTMATLTASAIFLLWLADIINKYGIGNGVAMIVVSGTVLAVFSWVYQGYTAYVGGGIGIVKALIIIMLVLGFLYVAFIFTSKEKRIELKNRKTKKEINIPLRISWVADAPSSLTSAILMFPATITPFINHPWLHSISSIFWPRSVTYFMIQGVLLFFCTYVYASIIFKPAYIQNLLQRFNFSLKSTEGKQPTEYLDNQLSKILIITAILLFLSLHMSTFLRNLLSVETSGGTVVRLEVISGIGLLVLVGVFFDILSQLEFFYQKSKASSKNLTVAYIAFDEIEAKIKSEYLKGKGINALVEPLRFTWGIPIRTAIDQYRIYTPARDVKKARKLIA
jgi:preprotein translocase subunit SecY